jgi:hypothetical protein
VEEAVAMTLEQRIAAALNAADIRSTDLDTLIIEAEAAAQAADEAAIKAHAEALDPSVVVDTAKVASAVAAATLIRDRLKAALPRLHTRYTEVRKREDVAKWKVEADQLAARRDELRTQFMQTLPVELLFQIVEQLTAMRAFDREIDALNYRAPDDVRRLHYATPELARELKIPDMQKPGAFLWPPPTDISAQLAAIPTDPFVIAYAAEGRYDDLRYKRALEDNRRQLQEAERSQREFDKQKAAEAEAAKQRDRQACRERGWPSG